MSKTGLEIRTLCASDSTQWLSMRAAMWPDLPTRQLEEEVSWIDSDERQVAIGVFDGSELVAFAELSIHPHAVGCSVGPVAYFEAWYVKEPYRRIGIGRRLLGAAEQWARGQGCRELASDTWLGNSASHEAHLALGFTETERLIHYRKPL